MSISAKVIADSISPQGIRLTTMQLRYPRFIHAEELTHRVLNTQPELIEIVDADGVMYDRNLSRNASSSRAIPVTRLIDDIIIDPAMPIYWGMNKPGMQAGAELEGTAKENAKDIWIGAMHHAIWHAQSLHDNGVHKQIVNRLLEPFSHINVVCTATDYANFYALRRHADAQPEMKALADAMWNAQQASIPKLLQPGEWHLPYTNFDDGHNRDPNRIKFSVARCARVSSLTHEGKPPNIEDDLRLYEHLVGSVPLHASPAEHQATPDTIEGGRRDDWCNPSLHGNLRGWIQYRKTLPNEVIVG